MLCHENFDVFGSKLAQIKTKYLCRAQNACRTLKGTYHSLSQFSKKPCDKLEKIGPIWLQFYLDHLQPKKLIITHRELTEYF